MQADNTPLAAVGVETNSTVDVQRRLRGGGGDGGATGAESRVSYLEMYMSKKPDKVQLAPIQTCVLASQAATLSFDIYFLRMFRAYVSFVACRVRPSCSEEVEHC